jgi:hypothetical protein
MSVRESASFLSLNRISELVCDSESYEASLRVTAALRTREVLKTSHGFHTCNQTDQHSDVTRPAAFLQMPLIKMKLFRVGQVDRSRHHPLRSGHGLLTLSEV